MRIPFIDDIESEQRPNAEATQHIKATLAAFGPGDAMGMTIDTWAKLHEALSVLIEWQDTFQTDLDDQAYANDHEATYGIK